MANENNRPINNNPPAYDGEDIEPEEGRRRRSRRRKNSGCAGTIVYMITVLGVAIVVSLIVIFVANDVFAFVTDDSEITINVEQNTSLQSLAKQLDDAGIINYGSVFKLYVKLKGVDKDEQNVLAGSYALNPNMDYGQIINALINSSSTETLKITIPEGYTAAQIKQLLLDEHVCTEDAADNALENYPFKHEFLKDEMPVETGWLEGYLFPDTYEIYKGNSTVVDSINKMLNNFDNKFDADIKAGAEELGRSMHDIVTIASLIEREVQKDEERAIVAGIIYNRLNNPGEFPFLQVDASVLYGLGLSSGKLTETDLAKDTPYNLYTREGLPPGPICNPGYKSLYAASHPDQNNYYYYVAMPDGTHLFANSYDEHQYNISVSDQAQAAAAAAAAAGTEGSGE